jgi:predicted RNA-binding protein with TRAM domain
MMVTAVKAVFEDGVFKPKEPVKLEERTEVEVWIPKETAEDGSDPTGWTAAKGFIGFIKDAPEGVPLAEEHDRYLRNPLAK